MFTALMYRQPHRADLPQWAARVRSIALESPDARTRMLLGNQLVHYYTAWLGEIADARLLIEALQPSPAEAEAAGPLAHIARRAMEAKYHWYVGEHEECLRVAKEGMETVGRDGATFSSLLETHSVYAHLTAGDVDAAERLLKETVGDDFGRAAAPRAGHFLSFLCAFHRDDFRSRSRTRAKRWRSPTARACRSRAASTAPGSRSRSSATAKGAKPQAGLAEARRIAREIRSPTSNSAAPMRSPTSCSSAASAASRFRSCAARSRRRASGATSTASSGRPRW